MSPKAPCRALAAAIALIPTSAWAETPCRRMAESQKSLYEAELSRLKESLAARGRPVRVEAPGLDFSELGLEREIVNAKPGEPFDIRFWQPEAGRAQDRRLKAKGACVSVEIQTIAYGPRSELLEKHSLRAYGWRKGGAIVGAYRSKEWIGVLHVLRKSLPQIASLSRPELPVGASVGPEKSAKELAKDRAYSACMTVHVPGSEGRARALELWDEAIALDPADAALLLARARCRADDDVAGRLTDLSRGLAVEPDSPALLRGRIELRARHAPVDPELASDVDRLLARKNAAASEVYRVGRAILEAEQPLWADGDEAGASNLRALARRAFDDCLKRPLGAEFSDCDGSLRWVLKMEEFRSRR